MVDVLTELALAGGLAAALALAAHWRAQARAALHAPPEPPPPPPPVDDTVILRFLSERGTLLGEQCIKAHERGPTMQYRARGKLGSFVFTGTEDGVCVYRRVGVERE